MKSETFAAVPRLKEVPVLRSTACFLAGSDDQRPVVGRIPKTSNAPRRTWECRVKWRMPPKRCLAEGNPLFGARDATFGPEFRR